MLSWAGKEVLIKAVAQAIPTFVMGCFDITKDMCDQISTMIARYWWSNQDKDNKIHWISWERLLKPKGEGGLGFRDIHIFNMAMLAKQGWRLIHNPESLCAQVLRAKYYPEGNPLKASPGRNMSYTWRSILSGLEVLKEGLVWRIGDGSKVNVWEDAWLPKEWSRKPITPKGHNLMTMVSELIDPSTGSWDVELVTQTFWPEDVHDILTIPVHVDLEDIVAWHYDKKGQFSVKSAYKAYRNSVRRRSRRGVATTSGVLTEEDEIWKKIWKLGCPGKVKQFLWRFTHNTLAVRRNLERRGLKIDTRCVMCNRHIEDGGHLFFNCKHVKQLWTDLALETHRRSLEGGTSVREVMAYILRLEERVKMRVIILLWQWWTERNRVREGERRRTSADLAFLVAKLADEFLELNKKEGTKPVKRSQPWRKPPDDFLKLNSDGAFSANRQEGGWGFVIRDGDGDVVVAGGGKLTHVRDAFQAEVMACITGVRAAVDMGIDKIIVEVDSLTLKLAMEDDSFRLAEAGGYIYELKNLMHMGFSSSSICFAPRSCNKVAHALAALGSSCSQGVDLDWGDVPEFVMGLVASDQAVPMS
ncbi:unnamed protein product [Urochloa humidicola]